MTYDWWATFLFRLSAIGSTDNIAQVYLEEVIRMYERVSLSAEERDLYSIDTFRTHEKTQKWLSHMFSNEFKLFAGIYRFVQVKEKFPQEIMFFTTDELGIMAFNQLEDGHYLIGVTGSPLRADGIDHGVFGFFQHDVLHIRPSLGTGLPQKVLERLGNISNPSDRAQAELALFIYSHEDGGVLHFKKLFLHFKTLFSQELKEYYAGTQTNLSQLQLRQLIDNTKTATRDMFDSAKDRFF